MDPNDFQREAELWAAAVVKRARALLEDGCLPAECIPLAVDIVGAQVRGRAPATAPLIDRVSLRRRVN